MSAAAKPTRGSRGRAAAERRDESAGTSLLLPMMTIAQQLRSWADGVIGIAGPVADLSMSVAQTRAKQPAQKAAIRQAGQQLRDWREAAGLTVQDLARAVTCAKPRRS